MLEEIIKPRVTWNKIMYEWYHLYASPVYRIEKDYWGGWSEIPFE